MGINVYISQTRDLCFNAVKTDLRQLILDKTSLPRENPPKLHFERLALEAKKEQKEESKDIVGGGSNEESKNQDETKVNKITSEE